MVAAWSHTEGTQLSEEGPCVLKAVRGEQGKQPLNETHRWSLGWEELQCCSGRENIQRGRGEQCGQETVRGSPGKEYGFLGLKGGVEEEHTAAWIK